MKKRTYRHSRGRSSNPTLEQARVGVLNSLGFPQSQRTRLLEQVSTPALERLLGIDQQKGIEAEHGDCLLLLHPGCSP